MTFSKQTRQNLFRKGVVVLGPVFLPDNTSDLPFSTGETGFKLNDNGTLRVRTFREVLELAR